MVVMDAFALPVSGTETRVSAGNEANEFMMQYIGSSPAVSHLSPVSTYASSAKMLAGLWIDRKIGECCRMVPFSSRLRLLVEWNRCADAEDQSEVY